MDTPIEPDKFKVYLGGRYEEQSKTIYNYLQAEKRFIKRYGQVINDLSIAKWVMFSNKHANPLNYGFIKAYLDCYGITYKFEKNRSRKYKPAPKVRFINPEEVKLLIDNLSPMLSLMVRIVFETGLRRFELMGICVKDIDFTTKHIKGKGKGNKDFKVHFSDTTGELLTKWIQEKGLAKLDKLFVFYKPKDNIPYKLQELEFWERLKVESEKLGFQNIHIHQIRHSLGRYLRQDKGFDLEQIRIKLRHDHLNTTQIYAEATQEEVDKKEDNEVFK